MKNTLIKMKKWFSKLSVIKKVLLIMLVLVAGWFAYTRIFKTKTTQVSYKTATVTRGTLIEAVSATGTVSSANNTPVVTQVTGAITKIYVKNGDSVKAGSPIATLQLDQYSQLKYSQSYSSYKSAQNSLESAKTQLVSLRSAKLTADNNFLKGAIEKGKDKDSVTYQTLNDAAKVADQNYSHQEDVIAQAQLQLTNAALSLQQLSPTVSAPISGTISGLALQEGSVIPAQAISSGSSNQVTSQNIANITTSAIPIVAADLSEVDIPKVQVGNKATLTFDAFPDKTFTGKVFSINTTGTVSSGVTSYLVTVTLDTENALIYPNMSAAVNIIVNVKDNVLSVPFAAVQTQNGQQYVRVLKNGAVENVNVTTGISSDTNTEITSGLNEGDAVVTAVATSGSTTSTTTASPFGILRGGAGGSTRAVIRD
jgi:HlyD family secretion protein